MDRDYIQPRRIGRRKTDQVLWDQLCRYQRLFRVGQVIASEMDPERLLQVIREQTDQVMEIERSRVFLYDARRDQLRSPVAGGRKREIRLSAHSGVPGWVFRHKSPLIVNDAYGDPRFDPEADETTGFVTRNTLGVPLVNGHGACIGVLEALNKKGSEFDDEDQAALGALSHYVAIALENSKRYRDLKRTIRATEQRIQSLGRDLTLPLDGVSRLVTDLREKGGSAGTAESETLLAEVRRHLSQLYEIRNRINDFPGDESLSKY